ncbi:MAG: hypothetical protein AAGB00_09450 [Planctomycetota bacterium]
MPALLLVLLAASAQAQHLDVLLQVVDQKIVTGEANYDTNTWLVGQRVYKRQFAVFQPFSFSPITWRTNDPGFTTLATGNTDLEPDVFGFAPGIDVLLDIVPSTIDGVRSNLWYWDGVDPTEDGFTTGDVAFDLPPEGVDWTLTDQNVNQFTADGSDTVLAGALIQESFPSGSVHEHLALVPEGPDGLPPEGIYVVSLVARAAGYEDSEPFFFVHRTPGLSNEPRDVAAAWVDANYDSLVQTGTPGDFNGDGMVDAADYTVWRDGFEVGDFGAADYLTWRDNFGEGTLNTAVLASQATAPPAPEPTGIALVAAAALAALPRRRRC